MIALVLLTIFLFVTEVAYFLIADRFHIIDKPNERSSHTTITLRGGGIIFPIAWLCFFIVSGGLFPWFTLGLVLVSVVSFWDDVRPLHNGIRLVSHVTGFFLCFYELGLWQDYPLWVMLLLLTGSIAALNIINFMDGINGMTGLYALSVLVPVILLEDVFFAVSVYNPWVVVSLSLIVFGFFNFRKKAKCFAGDVGSVSMGFILIFLVLGLMFGRWSTDMLTLSSKDSTSSFDSKYILLFVVYGVDGVLTIIQRLYNRENIFKAHRKHLYQLLVNEKGWPHLVVAGIYASIQLLISFWVINYFVTFYHTVCLIIGLCLFYILVKYFMVILPLRTNLTTKVTKDYH